MCGASKYTRSGYYDSSAASVWFMRQIHPLWFGGLFKMILMSAKKQLHLDNGWLSRFICIDTEVHLALSKICKAAVTFWEAPFA